MKKRYSVEQIIGFLKQASEGTPIMELCRKHGFSDASFYLWRRRFGGMDVPDAKCLRELEAENSRVMLRGLHWRVRAVSVADSVYRRASR